MRVKRLTISGELFCLLFTAGHHSGYSVVENSIPDDARLVNVRYGWPNVIELLLESASFPEVCEGEVIADLSPVITGGLPAQTADA